MLGLLIRLSDSKDVELLIRLSDSEDDVITN